MDMSVSTSPPTPVVVVSTSKPGGAERALAYLVGDLPRLGFDPAVLLLEPGPLEDWLREAGCQRVLVAGGPEEAPELARQLVGEVGARLVLAAKWNAHPAGAQAAQGAGIPVVWWQRDIARLTPAQIEAASYPADVVVCASRFSAEAQRRLTPRARIVQIQPGIPVATLASRATRTPEQRGRGDWGRPPLVGIVGRLDPFKGQHLFLQAAALIAQRRPDVEFAVVGGAVIGMEGQYPGGLHQLAQELGLTDRVRFTGHQADVVPWLNALDVAVLATDGEPFGLVVVEAMSVGVPVVATNVGGPTEIIRDRLSGRLVAPGDPEALAEAVLELLDEPELRRQISAAGVERAGDFTVERMTASFASLFTDLIASA